MAIPVIANVSTGQENASATLVLNYPASGVSNGDLFVILNGLGLTNTATAQFDNSTNKPSGYTMDETDGDATVDVHCATFWKIADGTENGGTITCNAATSDEFAGILLHITGAATSSPIDVSGTADTLGTGSTHVADEITTGEANTLALAVICAHGSDTESITASGTGWDTTPDTEYTPSTSGASGCGIAISSKGIASAGLTGDCTFTLGASDGAIKWQFSIKESSAAVVITDVDTDETWDDGDTGLVITGTGFT